MRGESKHPATSVVTCSVGIEPRSSLRLTFYRDSLVPQCPSCVHGTTLFAEKHIGVTLQESELVADVYNTKAILVGAGCLAP